MGLGFSTEVQNTELPTYIFQYGARRHNSFDRRRYYLAEERGGRRALYVVRLLELWYICIQGFLQGCVMSRNDDSFMDLLGNV